MRLQHPSETRNPAGTEADTLQQECEWRPGDRGASTSAADKGLEEGTGKLELYVVCHSLQPQSLSNASTRKGFPSACCCEALTGPVRVASKS